MPRADGERRDIDEECIIHVRMLIKSSRAQFALIGSCEEFPQSGLWSVATLRKLPPFLNRYAQDATSSHRNRETPHLIPRTHYRLGNQWSESWVRCRAIYGRERRPEQWSAFRRTMCDFKHHSDVRLSSHRDSLLVRKCKVAFNRLLL